MSLRWGHRPPGGGRLLRGRWDELPWNHVRDHQRKEMSTLELHDSSQTQGDSTGVPRSVSPSITSSEAQRTLLMENNKYVFESSTFHKRLKHRWHEFKGLATSWLTCLCVCFISNWYRTQRLNCKWLRFDFPAECVREVTLDKSKWISGWRSQSGWDPQRATCDWRVGLSHTWWMTCEIYKRTLDQLWPRANHSCCWLEMILYPRSTSLHIEQL